MTIHVNLVKSASYGKSVKDPEGNLNAKRYAELLSNTADEKRLKTDCGSCVKEPSRTAATPWASKVSKPRISLSEAICKGRRDVIDNWLARGADVNHKQPKRLHPPLVTAAILGDAEILTLLLDAGAEVETTTQGGGTALLWAVDRQHAPAVQILLAHGADPHAASCYGSTPMRFAERDARDSVTSKVILDMLRSAELARASG